MEFYEKDFGKILKANALKQRRMMLQYGTDCMRVYDRNLEQFPVTVDLYGKYARITDYSVDGMEEAMRETCCDIVSRMLYVQSDHVVFYHREKRIGREQHETLSEVSVKTLVKENGLTFTVDLTRHIDTGLFLDHAVTREWVRENCQGLSVLNLFSYTGAFSVYAAAGGAASVVSVDLSGPYTQWAKENLKANGFEGDLYPCVQMDALRFVERELAKGSKYQLIVFDPPTFSNSHKMDGDFDVQRDHAKWLWLLNGLLVQGGRVVFSTNLGSFRLDERKVHGYAIEEVSREVAAPGFTKKTGTSRTWLLTKMEEAGPLPEDIADFGVVAGNNLQEEQIMSEEVKDQEEVVMEVAAEEKKPAKKTTRKSTAKKAVKSVAEADEAAPKAKKTTRKSTKKATEEPVVEQPKSEEAPVEESKVEEPVVEQPKAEEIPAEAAKAEEPVVEQPKAEEAPAEAAKAEEPATEQPKAEEVKADEDVLTLDWSETEEPQTASSDEDAADQEEAKEESAPEADDRMSIAARAFQPRPYGGRPDKKDEADADDEDRPARRGGRDRDDRGYGRRGNGDRDDRDYGRRSYGDRDDRGYGRRDFGDRDDRGYGRRSYGDRDDRGYGRRSYGDRDDRGYGRRDFGDRDDRGYGRRSYGDRDDRGYGRRDFGDRDDRGYGRRSYGDRDDRGYGRRDFGDRDDRGYGRRDFGDRDDRGYGRRSYGDRDDRGYGRRDDRGFGRRDGFSRPSRYTDRDDRRGQKPYGMDKFRPSGARRADDEGKSFFWLEKDNKKNDDEQ